MFSPATMLHLTLQNFNTRDLLQNMFCPLVGAVSSAGADDICQKNNLSFVELLQPFSKINSAANIGDSLINSSGSPLPK